MIWRGIFLLLVTSVLGARRTDDICHHHGGRRFYVDLGESKTLTAGNLTLPTGLWPTGRGPGPPNRFNESSHQQCSVEYVTCPSCVFRVTFKRLNLSRQCGGGNLVMDSPCRCDYVWISEPPFDNHVGQQYCGLYQDFTNFDGSPLLYDSKTRTLSISLLYSEDHKFAFSLEVSSKSNRQTIIGGPAGYENSTGILTSPYFPSFYPRELSTEYALSCSDSNCRIRVIFSDFQMAASSFVEFFDATTQRVEMISGSSFRPHVYISSGPSLTIRFFANGGSGSGFKATYSFISGPFAETAVKPITDCGGYVEDFGGAITMMNMVSEGIGTYDCIWLIRPPENFLHLKTHLFLKVATFLDFAGSTELEIRQGLTSDGPLLETLRHPVSQLHFQRPREHLVPVTFGFYVRLQGTFNAASRLAITYAAFSYKKCFPGSEYLCANHRCIPGKLSCDSFDHCGDNSDEPPSCYQEWASELGDRQWYSQTPNYFFPKTDRYADLKTATVIFLVSSLGLIVIISTLIIVLYRMNSRARQQRELQSHLQTISELLDSARIEEIVPDEPPDYEAPPDYEEIIKSTPSSATRRKRRVSRQSSRRSRSSPGERRRRSPATPVPILEVALPSERPRRSRHLRPRSVQRSNSNASAISEVSRCEQSSPLPDSPPPPYTPLIIQPFFDETPPSSFNAMEADVARETPSLIEIPPSPIPWSVTSVIPQEPLEPQPIEPRRRQYHQRSMSCIDHRRYQQYAQRRQTQSNPLTPTLSPKEELTVIQTPPLSPSTDTDFYLFSSLESSDLNSSYVKSKDFFDWEQFDRQFPGRRTNRLKGQNIGEVLKKNDEVIFVNNVKGCDCLGACCCSTLPCQSNCRETADDVWGKICVVDILTEQMN